MTSCAVGVCLPGSILIQRASSWYEKFSPGYQAEEKKTLSSKRKQSTPGTSAETKFTEVAKVSLAAKTPRLVLCRRAVAA